MGLLAHQDSIQPPNRTPEWTATPNTDLVSSIVFVAGVGGTYNFVNDTTDPEGDTLTFAKTAGSWPNNTTLNSNGLLTVMSSVTAETQTGITLTASDAEFSPTSNSFSVVINASAVPDPDWIIPASFNYSADGYWDGDNPSSEVLTHAQDSQTSVSANDIIQLASGNRLPLRMRNVHGTSGNRVIIRSDPAGKTTMARGSASGGGFVFWIQDTTHFDLDGAFTDGDTFGIKVTTTQSGDDPSAYLQLLGICDNYTLNQLELDGNWPAVGSGGIGIQHNDNAVTEAQQPWRENIIVQACYMHDLEGEGGYIGPNFGNPALDDVPTRNVQFRYCVMINCGRDGAQIKSSIEGTNVFHHNYVKTTGLRTTETQAGQKLGLGFFEGSGTAHNNWIEDAGEHGISMTTLYRPNSFDPLPDYICYNNVIINSGAIDTAIAADGFGLHCFRPSGSFAEPGKLEWYNNTVVDTEEDGAATANIGSDIFLENNIIFNSGDDDISLGGGGTHTETNNITTDPTFINASIGNYGIQTTSNCKNQATSGLVAATDNAGMLAWVLAGADPQDLIEPYVASDKARPLGADECIGALEFVE